MDQLLQYIEEAMTAERDRVNFEGRPLNQKRAIASVVTKVEEARMWLRKAEENGYTYKGKEAPQQILG